MRLLDYLVWLGEAALKPRAVFYWIAKVAEKLLDDYYETILGATKHIFLMTASGKWLDRWGWNLVRLRRKYGEDDESYRQRIILALLQLKATRKALREIIIYLLGKPPIEIYEPIRDSGYFNCGDFYLNNEIKAKSLLSAAVDGTGSYCARFGTLEDTSYTGRIRVLLPEFSNIGVGLQFFNGLDFYNCSAFFLSGQRKRMPPRSEFISVIEKSIVAGTEVSIEFV